MEEGKKKKFWEAIFHTPEEVKRRERVRKRKSYLFWKEVAEDYKNFSDEEREIIMRKINRILDKKRAWGTASHAIWAEESLELLLEDLRQTRDTTY